jgi:hypothetical protein
VGEWRYSSTILNFDTRWRWVFSFTQRSLHPRRKSRLYPFDKRLGGPKIRPGRCGEEKNFLFLPRINPVRLPVASRYTDWAIPAHQYKVIPTYVYNKSLEIFPPSLKGGERSSDVIVAGHGLNGRGLIPSMGKKSHSAPQLTLRRTQPPIQWLLQGIVN